LRAVTRHASLGQPSEVSRPLKQTKQHFEPLPSPVSLFCPGSA
jgi:hypothetical protein